VDLNAEVAEATYTAFDARPDAASGGRMRPANLLWIAPFTSLKWHVTRGLSVPSADGGDHRVDEGKADD
jgi:hypothetical protein